VRFGEVFRYEFGYRMRSASTWGYAVFLFLIIVWGTLATADGGAVNANAPIQVAQATVLFGGLFGLAVSAALFGDAAIRDVAVGMDQLLFTTRLRKAEFLGGRFLAALAVNAIVVLALPLGHMVVIATPLVGSEPLGPFRLAAYAQPLLLFSWPNLILAGAILLLSASLYLPLKESLLWHGAATACRRKLRFEPRCQRTAARVGLATSDEVIGELSRHRGSETLEPAAGEIVRDKNSTRQSDSDALHRRLHGRLVERDQLPTVAQ